MVLLEVKELRVNYGGVEALRGISFDVEKGSIVAVIGNNGAGKTTTLSVISGLRAPTAGEIRFEGERINNHLPQKIVKNGIGHIPEGRSLFPYMNVMENLRLGAFLRSNKRSIEKDMEEIFNHFPVLRERRKQRAITLSGGEQQMLAIARAIMGRPKLLLLDEFSLGLSPLNIREIAKILLEVNQRGVSLVLVEQNVRLALSLAHRGYVLETGIIVLEGAANELMNSEKVKKVYLGK